MKASTSDMENPVKSASNEQALEQETRSRLRDAIERRDSEAFLSTLGLFTRPTTSEYLCIEERRRLNRELMVKRLIDCFRHSIAQAVIDARAIEFELFSKGKKINPVVLRARGRARRIGRQTEESLVEWLRQWSRMEQIETALVNGDHETLMRLGRADKWSEPWDEMARDALGISESQASPNSDV